MAEKKSNLPENKQQNSPIFSKNKVTGDIVGNNKLEAKNIYHVDNIKFEEHHHPIIKASTGLQALYEKYKEEQKNGSTEFRGFIEKIQHYDTDIEQSDVRGLVPKLEDAGFEEDCDWALMEKERYWKSLMGKELSNITQEIHAFLLAKVASLFRHHILPSIRKGNKTNPEIHDLIKEKILDEIEVSLGENILRLYDDDINGMLYFLTGNCHLIWK